VKDSGGQGTLRPTELYLEMNQRITLTCHCSLCMSMNSGRIDSLSLVGGFACDLFATYVTPGS